MFKTLFNKTIPQAMIWTLFKNRTITSFSRFSICKSVFDVNQCIGIKVCPQNRSLTTSVKCFSSAEESAETEQKAVVDPSKDRTKIIPPEVGIRYLKSTAYKTTYGDLPVWAKYRRNFKGPFVPRRTRKSCVRNGVISTGNPCPICRDEYLVLHYTNVDLLKQFISPQTGEILDGRKTHVCRKKLFELEVAITKAKFYGLITHEVPFIEYNYEEYYPQLKQS